MGNNENVYWKIAKKYTDKPITSEQDVDYFYTTFLRELPKKDVEMILNELTEEIYNNSSPKDYHTYPGGDEYPQDGDRQLSFFDRID